MSKDELVGEYMQSQLAMTMTILHLLLKKGIFTAEEFNKAVLRTVSDLDQELAKPAAGESDKENENE